MAMRRNRYGTLLAATAMGVALAGSAYAHVAIEVDPLRDAEANGRSILSLERVWVAVFGNEHFDVRDIARRSLRLGSHDTAGGRARGIKLVDVNGDGIGDMLARFEVAETGLRDSSERDAVLTGGLKDGRTLFIAYDSSLGVTDDPTSNCANVTSGDDTIGVRCAYATSIDGDAPLDLASLVTALNQNLAGSDLSIQAGSAVVVELFGGKGHKGAEKSTAIGKMCAGGSGGARGYARTIFTQSTLADLAPDLYLYVAQDGQTNQGGGASSVLSGSALSDVTSDNLQNPSAAKVIAIAGGGGGGGHGATDSNDAACEAGYDGGDGSAATANTDGAASMPGRAGANSDAGLGGNPDLQGLGGAGDDDGANGTAGIGGFGSNGDAAWAGATLTSWAYGTGGAGGDGQKAGGGGGGFGGGGGAGEGKHKGGGGSGGSWARKATAPLPNNDLILGSSYSPGHPAIYLTFEVLSEDR